jgi:hypothetical protein
MGLYKMADVACLPVSCLEPDRENGKVVTFAA